MYKKVVISTKGHDKDNIYILLDDKNLLVDGKKKLLSNPKYKNKNHFEIIGEVWLKIHKDGLFRDVEIKREIKLFKKNYKKKEDLS